MLWALVWPPDERGRVTLALQTLKGCFIIIIDLNLRIIESVNGWIERVGRRELKSQVSAQSIQGSLRY